MEQIRQFLNPLLETLGKYFPSVLGALVVFLVGLGFARLVRKAVAGLLGKFEIDQKLSEKTENTFKVESFLSNLIYYITLLWVLLLTLDILGVKGVLVPLTNMFNELLTILPNIVSAILMGFAGYVVAKIVSSAVTVMAKSMDSLAPKLGFGEEFMLSKLLGQIVFIIIFIPILISSFDVLKIEAISAPATEMLNILLAAIPSILAAVLILAIAYIVGRFVTDIIAELLQNLGADQLSSKLSIQGFIGKETSFSRLCGNVILFFIMLGAAIAAVEKLSMTPLSVLLGNFILFASDIVIGLVVLAIGNFIANLAYQALSKNSEQKTIATIARVAILLLVLAMGLRAMGIADDIVTLAFGLTLGAIAVAVALSFGFGGQEAAGKQMEFWLSRFRQEDKE